MIKVYAHDSGQRYNWAYAPESVNLDRKRWIETVNNLGNMPIECVGRVKIINLSEIDETDVYVG